MTETARLAVFHGTGKRFEIREYPVPDPEPGAMLIKIALANVCGSDMHYWRGEQDYAKMGRPLPLNTGHEHVGTVAKLGAGRHHGLGGPAARGRRPRRCTATSSLADAARPACGASTSPARRASPTGSSRARCGRTSRAASASTSTCARITRCSRSRRRDHRRDGGRHQLRLHAGLRGARDRRSSAPGRRWSCRARAGSASTRARWRARWARPGRGDRRRRRAARRWRSSSAPPTSSTCAEHSTPADADRPRSRSSPTTGAATWSSSWWATRTSSTRACA